MAAIVGEGKIFGKLQRLHSLDTLWVENFDEIALSRTIKEIEAKVKVGVLHPVQQPGSYWDRSSELPLVGLEPTEVTAYD